MRKHLLAYLTPFRGASVQPLRLSLLGLFSLFSLSVITAQTCQDASVQLSAAVQADPTQDNAATGNPM
jgi:hypothetical protein